MRVLIAAAQTALRRQAALALAPARAAADEAAGLDDLMALARGGTYDLILLGPDLADSAALDALRRLRAAGIAVPVVWLCGDAASAERARALDLGADDCVGPSVAPAELLARARAVVRRSAGHASSVLRVGVLSIDIAARAVVCAGRRLRITGKEFGLLELLALRRGTVVSRAALMDHLYGGPEEPVAKVIDIHVCRLRRKLAEAAPGEPLLRTVWGQGFVLGEPSAVRARTVLAA